MAANGERNILKQSNARYALVDPVTAELWIERQYDRNVRAEQLGEK